jgi:RND family efflux transporter MFP subunit
MRPVEELKLRPEQRVQRVPRWRGALDLTLKTVLPLAILAVAAAVVWRLHQTAPVAERTPPPRVPRLVEAITVAPAERGPLIEAWGEVTAARTLALRPETEGTVVWVNDRLTPGGFVRAGEALIRLDDREQRLAVAAAEAEIRQIQARIAIERGQQERARRDLARLPGTLTEEQRGLVLREPQMAELEAELAAAEAARDRALVDSSHTVLHAPFDALVITEEVAPGTMLTSGTTAATLVAADRFHITLAVPPSALDWIDPGAGQTVRLAQPAVWPEGSFREGTVERLSARLTPVGRMAELIVAVDDPLALKPENGGKPQLLLGSFVRALAEGQPLENAVLLDRAYLRDGDTVWVIGPDNRLEIRAVHVAWRGTDSVLVSSGLAPGERVVTTPLAVVAPGMEVRLASEAAMAATAGAGP